jgi:hypothetical protein
VALEHQIPVLNLSCPTRATLGGGRPGEVHVTDAQQVDRRERLAAAGGGGDLLVLSAVR